MKRSSSIEIEILWFIQYVFLLSVVSAARPSWKLEIEFSTARERRWRWTMSRLFLSVERNAQNKSGRKIVSNSSISIPFINLIVLIVIIHIFEKHPRTFENCFSFEDSCKHTRIFSNKKIHTKIDKRGNFRMIFHLKILQDERTSSRRRSSRTSNEQRSRESRKMEKYLPKKIHSWCLRFERNESNRLETMEKIIFNVEEFWNCENSFAIVQEAEMGWWARSMKWKIYKENCFNCFFFFLSYSKSLSTVSSCGRTAQICPQNSKLEINLCYFLSTSNWWNLKLEICFNFKGDSRFSFKIWASSHMSRRFNWEWFVRLERRKPTIFRVSEVKWYMRFPLFVL